MPVAMMTMVSASRGVMGVSGAHAFRRGGLSTASLGGARLRSVLVADDGVAGAGESNGLVFDATEAKGARGNAVLRAAIPAFTVAVQSLSAATSALRPGVAQD